VQFVSLGPKSISQLNPNSVIEQINKNAKIVGNRYTRAGNLEVRVSSMEEANRLLKIKEFGTCPVKADFPGHSMALYGRINKIHHNLDDEGILAALKPYGVVHVKREVLHQRD